MSKMIHPTNVEMVYIDNDVLVSDQPWHMCIIMPIHKIRRCPNTIDV